MAESANGKVDVRLLDELPRQQLAERTSKAEEAHFESTFRRTI